MEEESKDKNILGTMPIGRLMVKFAVPSIVAMLVGALYNIVDQFFIGQAVGTDGNAATNIAFPLTTSCIALALLFGVGGASCFNLAMGKKEYDKAPYFAGNSIVMLTIGGVLLSAISEIFLTQMLVFFGSPENVLPYAQEYVRVTAIGFPFLILTTGGGHLVRADGSPGTAMFCNIIGAVINTALDALFVFGFGWGMTGAAAATVVGQVVSAAVTLFYLFRKFKTVKLEKKHFIINPRHTGRVMSIGMASFFNQLAMMVVQIVLNNSLRYYGGLSSYGESIPIACAGIVMKVNQIVFSFAIGLGQGSQPIESYNYGARKYKRVRQAYYRAAAVSVTIAVTAFIFFWFFPRNILALFGEGTEEYFEFGEKFFHIFLFFVWLTSLQPVTSTMFTSIGKPIKGVFLSLTRQIIFFLPLLVILPNFLGIDGVVYSGFYADILSGVTTIIMLVIEFRLMKKQERELERESAASAG